MGRWWGTGWCGWPGLPLAPSGICAPAQAHVSVHGPTVAWVCVDVYSSCYRWRLWRRPGSDLPPEAMLVSENHILAGATLSGLGSHLGSSVQEALLDLPCTWWNQGKISMTQLAFITSFCLLRPEWTCPQKQSSVVGETIKAETNADWLSSSRISMGQTYNQFRTQKSQDLRGSSLENLDVTQSISIKRWVKHLVYA